MNVSSMRVMRWLITVVVCATAATSCGDVVRQSRAPVYVTITKLESAQGNTLQSDVLNDNDTVSNDMAHAELQLTPKNIDPGLAPTTNNQVTIKRYRVSYRRADGRSVPAGFDGAVTGTIALTGTSPFDFEIVRQGAKVQSPLVELAATHNIISTIADVTFYGADQVGNEVSATGSMSIDFGDFAGSK